MGLEIRLLGRFVVRRDGQEVPPGAFRQRLSRVLVRVLLTRPSEFVSHDVLTEALWRGRPPADPAANLRVLVAAARQALQDPGRLVTRAGGYLFDTEGCVIDAGVFVDEVQRAQAHLQGGELAAARRGFRSALGRWGGEPLAEDAYEEWAQEFRTRLFWSHLQALEGAATCALAEGDAGEAVTWSERALAQEPFRERSHLLLVESLAMSGDMAAALRAYEVLRRTFADELGLDPSAEAEGLQSRILRGELRAPRPVSPGARIVPPIPELAFVGRAEELEAVLEQIQHEPPGVALVTGLAGAGKSRLLAEVAGRSALPLVRAGAVAPEKDVAWALAGPLLREALAIDVDAARAVPPRSAAALAEVVPELQDLGTGVAGPLDPESRRALALEGAVCLFAAVSTKGLVLIADDVQWADATSLSLLGLLARRVSRMAQVLAYRPGEAAAESRVGRLLDELDAADRGVLRVDLGALSPEAIAGLFAERELGHAIAEETDGTPLGVREVVVALIEEGALGFDHRGRLGLRRDADRGHAREAARAGRRRAIQARVRRQPERRRRLLAVLALLGREAPARLLAEVEQAGEPALLQALDTLARAGLVRLGPDGWAVAHDVVGGAVVECLSPAERAGLHAALASALASDGAEPAEIGSHLVGAGDARAAATCYVLAARQSLDRYASSEAEQLADAGLALGTGSRIDVDLLDIRAEARARSGDIRGAREDLRAVLQHPHPGHVRSRLLTRTALLVADIEGYDEELIELALIDAGSDAGARAEALVAEGILDAYYRPERAGERLAQARALFEGLGDAEGVARTMDAEASHHLGQGHITEAAAMLRRVARLFRDAGMLARAGTTQSYCAVALMFSDRPDEALVEVEEALALERSLGHRDAVFCLCVKAWALIELGRAEEAKGTGEQALAAARVQGHRPFLSIALQGLGVIFQALGDLDEAERCLREAWEAGQGMPHFSAFAAAQLARLLVRRGKLDEAATYVAEGLATIPLFQYYGRLAQAELAVARGEPAASEMATEALALAEAGGHLATARPLRELIAATPSLPAR